MIKTFYSISDWRNDHFLLWHWLLWIQSNFQVTKKQQQQQQQQIKRLNTRRKRSHLVYFIQSQSELSQNETKKRRQQTEKPALNLQRDAQKLAQNVFQPWRPTLTSRSLQSIARQFQKRFREVFENARILIFYISMKDWEKIFTQISFRMVLFSVWWR